MYLSTEPGLITFEFIQLATAAHPPVCVSPCTAAIQVAISCKSCVNYAYSKTQYLPGFFNLFATG